MYDGSAKPLLVVRPAKLRKIDAPGVAGGVGVGSGDADLISWSGAKMRCDAAQYPGAVPFSLASTSARVCAAS